MVAADRCQATAPSSRAHDSHPDKAQPSDQPQSRRPERSLFDPRLLGAKQSAYEAALRGRNPAYEAAERGHKRSLDRQCSEIARFPGTPPVPEDKHPQLR